MAENFALRTEVRELKLGASFTNPKSTALHTVRYDFKPASVDVNKSALVNVSNNNQVTVNVPHLDGAGTSQTVFKGSQKPYYKECVLIIDRVTGEITLEKLTSNIQVKKTRSESNNKPGLDRTINNTARSLTPVEQRVNSKTKKISAPHRKDRPVTTTTNLAPKHSPLQASPNHRSPRHVKQPEKSPTTSASPMAYGNHQQSTSASLPVIGFDDYQPPPTNTHQEKSPQINGRSIPPPPVAADNTIGILSDSSSSSSGSDDSGSGSDSESEANTTVINNSSAMKRVSPAQYASSDSESDDNQKNGNLSTNNGTTLPNHLLSEDLCLSESGSDSD